MFNIFRTLLVLSVTLPLFCAETLVTDDRERSHPHALSEEQIRDFLDNGTLIIKNFFNPEEVNRVKEHANSLTRIANELWSNIKGGSPDHSLPAGPFEIVRVEENGTYHIGHL